MIRRMPQRTAQDRVNGIITLCPKCLLENNPSGQFEPLYLVEDAARCDHHGAIPLSDLKALFERARSESRFHLGQDLPASRSLPEDK